MMKEMQQNQHGSYSEITDEKEVVRVTAYVLNLPLQCFSAGSYSCLDESLVAWFIFTIPTLCDAKSWTVI